MGLSSKGQRNKFITPVALAFCLLVPLGPALSVTQDTRGPSNYFFPYQDCILGKITGLNVEQPKKPMDTGTYKVTVSIDDLLKGEDDLAPGRSYTFEIAKLSDGILPDKPFVNLVGTPAVFAFDRVIFTPNQPFNLYAPFPFQIFSSEDVGALKSKLGKPVDDNCIVGTVLDCDSKCAWIKLKVESVLAGRFRAGETIRLNCDEHISPDLAPKTGLVKGGRFAIGFTESSGANVTGNPMATDNGEEITICNIHAPFPFQIFNIVDEHRLAEKLGRQRQEMISALRKYVKNYWTIKRISDFCRLESRGLSEEDNRTPYPDQQFLCLSSQQRTLFPEASGQIGHVFCSAIVKRGTPILFRIMVVKGKDVWLPSWRSPTLAPIDEDEFIVDRLDKTLIHSLNHYRTAHDNSAGGHASLFSREIEDEYPSSQTEHIVRDQTSKVTAFVWVGRDLHQMKAELDDALNIKAILKDGLPDPVWEKIYEETKSNYSIYEKEMALPYSLPYWCKPFLRDP